MDAATAALLPEPVVELMFAKSVAVLAISSAAAIRKTPPTSPVQHKFDRYPPLPDQAVWRRRQRIQWMPENVYCISYFDLKNPRRC